jgi:hypothetical protein
MEAAPSGQQRPMQLLAPTTLGSTSDVPIRWNAGAGRGGNHVPSDHAVEVAPFSRSIGFGAAYQFSGGVAQALHGIEVLVERGGPVAVEQVLAGISKQLDEMPAIMLEKLRQIIVYKGQDVAYDRYWEKAYGIPGFQAVAAGGGGQVTFFGGRPYTDGVLFHELGHNLGMGSFEWNRAAKEDDKVVAQLGAGATLRYDEFEPVPDPVRRARWTARLAPGGITPYSDGRPGEDVCEALRMLLSERHRGHAFATRVDNATGGVSALPFSVAYPARTKVLERATNFDLDGDGDIGE